MKKEVGKEVGFRELSALGLLDTAGEGAVQIAEMLMADTYQRYEAVSLAMWLLRKPPNYQASLMVTRYRVIESHEPPEPVIVEATIVVTYRGAQHHVAGIGDGPVNALDNALRKVVGTAVSVLILGEYSVSVQKTGERVGSASRVKVVIDWELASWHFRTVGTATSVVEASWSAMLDAFEFTVLTGGKLLSQQ